MIAGNFIAENVAPAEAKRIIVCGSDGQQKGVVPLGHLKTPDRSKRLYSFGVVSDVHIGKAGAEDNFRAAINYFAKDDDVSFICNCGDTTYGSLWEDEAGFKTYASIIKECAGGKKVLTVSGNHEQIKYRLADDGSESNDGEWWYARWMHEYAGWKEPVWNEDGTKRKVHLFDTYQPKDGVKDVFVLLNCFGYYQKTTDNWNIQVFPATNKPPYVTTYYKNPPEIASGTYGEICEYIKNAKEAGCRVFVLHHVAGVDELYPNAEQSYGKPAGDLAWEHKANPTRYQYIPLSVFENTVVFSGHTHYPFKYQENDKTKINYAPSYTGRLGVHSVHVPACCDYAQGYIVDVYEDGIHLRGKNFATGEDVAIGTYWVDTQ